MILQVVKAMGHTHKRIVFLAGLLGLLVWSSPKAWAKPSSLSPSLLRARVLTNIRASQKARASSRFPQFARSERQGFRHRSRPLVSQRTTFGPHNVPSNFVVHGGGSQPNVLFNKRDRHLKRQIRRKAAKLRMANDMKPWAKIERVQEIVRAKVKHAGNVLDVKKNPNRYNRYNAKKKSSGELARLSDYLKMNSVVCREMAFLTQVALEDAGFQARLVRGDIIKGGKKIGGHAWNEVKLKGKWYIVDTTNTGFNKTDPFVARDQGTRNGWHWRRSENRYEIGPKNPKARSGNLLQTLWRHTS